MEKKNKTDKMIYIQGVLLQKDEALTFKAGGINDTNTGVRASTINIIMVV